MEAGYLLVLKLLKDEPKDQKGTYKYFPAPVDLVSMTKSELRRDVDTPSEWNLVLIAASPDEPDRVLRFLAGAVSTCGGWILKRQVCGEECAEIEFEFPRANCVEIYSVMLATGVNLSREAHKQLTELCQCTSYLLESRALDVVRLHLTVYTHASEAKAARALDEEETEAA